MQHMTVVVVVVIVINCTVILKQTSLFNIRHWFVCCLVTVVKVFRYCVIVNTMIIKFIIIWRSRIISYRYYHQQQHALETGFQNF